MVLLAVRLCNKFKLKFLFEKIISGFARQTCSVEPGLLDRKNKNKSTKTTAINFHCESFQIMIKYTYYDRGR